MNSWNVGSVKVTAVVESADKTSPRFLFRSITREGVLEVVEGAPWLQPDFVDADGYLMMRTQCLVIDTGDLRIAVDTCVGNDKVRVNAGWSSLQTNFLNDFVAAGYDPESIDYVVCTHLHVDHIGWNTKLVDGHWVPTFPNARYVFVRRELEHWQGEGPTPGEDLLGDSVTPVIDAGLVDLVDSTHKICPQVRFDPTPGHTPGHVSVVIESEGAHAVITGDMIHSPIQIARTELSSDFDTDRVMSAKTREDFLARYLDETLVIGTHWGGAGSGRIRRNGAGEYRVEV